jgi:hypothetical protein
MEILKGLWKSPLTCTVVIVVNYTLIHKIYDLKRTRVKFQVEAKKKNIDVTKLD